MRVLILTRHTGREGVRVPGQICDLHDDEAEGLIEVGAADFAPDEAPMAEPESAEADDELPPPALPAADVAADLTTT